MPPTRIISRLAFFEELRSSKEIAQRVTLMGDESLGSGFLKIMLDEDNLPELGELQKRTSEPTSKVGELYFIASLKWSFICVGSASRFS